MRKVFLYQVYTNLAYVLCTYSRVKQLRVLVINKDVLQSLARKKGNKILIWRWNDSMALDQSRQSSKSYVTDKKRKIVDIILLLHPEFF